LTRLITLDIHDACPEMPTSFRVRRGLEWS
jgi:hypothetical protein